MKAHGLRQFTDEDGGLPPWDVVEARLADRSKPLPWLTPEGLAALAECARNGEPEISGPETFADFREDD